MLEELMPLCGSLSNSWEFVLQHKEFEFSYKYGFYYYSRDNPQTHVLLTDAYPLGKYNI